MIELLAQSTKFINIEEVEIANKQADQPFDQEISCSKKGNDKENRLPKL